MSYISELNDECEASKSYEPFHLLFDLGFELWAEWGVVFFQRRSGLLHHPRRRCDMLQKLFKSLLVGANILQYVNH